MKVRIVKLGMLGGWALALTGENDAETEKLFSMFEELPGTSAWERNADVNQLQFERKDG